MLRLLAVCVAVLLLLYGLKVALLQLVVPMDSQAPLDLLGIGRFSSGPRADRVDADDPLAGAGINSSALREGAAAYRRGDDATAVQRLRDCLSSADEPAGAHAACRTMLGEMHLVGAGVAQNLTEATLLFQAAAEAGDADAQFNLGLLHSTAHAEGDDVYRQEALAVLYMYAASTAGHPGALMAMGYRHQHGYGVPKACTTAARNYIDLAKKVASIYSAGMPQAVELIRLNLNSKDHQTISPSERMFFVQLASNGDLNVAYAIGKRWLLGIEGFGQDYEKAKQYLTLAANGNHPGAQGLLGYMHCLGLGMPRNLNVAYGYFVSASLQGDPLGHNGLGYIYFRGTGIQARNYNLAFRHFNESAVAGSSDGMFNLAGMYLTGTGTSQSFHMAVMFYTQALDRGHTPAAYSLAIMHLNGIGAPRSCDIAVKLLKTVCDRGTWITNKLADAYELGETKPDRAALLFLKLAEAGHEVAQMNAAHLFDAGRSSIFFPGNASAEDARFTEETRQHSRILAQRYYEMSAEQGSASSQLRLGDYAFYGWGVTASFKAEDDDEDADSNDGILSMQANTEVQIRPQAVDYEASLARYRKTAEMTVTGMWMQGFVARGHFNMGFMHQFGLGVPQDLQTAKMYYHRSREVDPGATHAPVTMVLMLLGWHMIFLRLPTWPTLAERLLADVRVHKLALHLAALVVLAAGSAHFSRARRRARPARRSRQDAAPAAPARGGPAT
ncbi:unnamed protein product [Prorocentrum cordatum]|uniref:Uncharacterized protein n=1 Tax=Prorocentrum cordatum TaxID=2364126 RepID=A0ABN9Q6T8_9DINO|nr:unnamed protein product [Polarella glacialis]